MIELGWGLDCWYLVPSLVVMQSNKQGGMMQSGTQENMDYSMLDLELKLNGSTQLTPNSTANPSIGQVRDGMVGGSPCLWQDLN